MELTPACQTEDAVAPPPRSLGFHVSITIFWLSNSMVWGALLHLALQSRLSDWFSEQQVGYYIGLVGALGGVIAFVTPLLVGAFSDRSLHPWGRRRPYLMSGVLLSTATLVFLGGTQSFWPFVGLFLLLQLFMNAALGPYQALLPDSIPANEYGKASGFMGIGRLIGDTGGLVLAARLLSAGHLEGHPQPEITAFHDQRFWLLCVAMATFLLLTMLYTVAVIRERPLRRREPQSFLQTVRGAFHIDAHGNRDFLWLSLSRAITNLGFYMFLQMLFFFLKFSLKLPDPEHSSMMVMLPAIAMAVLSSLPAGIISDRMGKRRPLVFVAQFLMAGAALVFVFAPNLTWAYVAGIPAGLAYGVFTCVEWALACTLIPKGEAAKYFGLWSASAVVPQIFAAPLGGAIGSALSASSPGLGWRVVFVITALCCVIGAIFLRHVHEKPLAPGGAAAPPAMH